ncbi:BQ2448_2045 [Microbotryum intermedium]|uniref:BQ2448_2045 protein n=1 Tax=Microbotryum intermedium TaxID=269621 RepID=A0A238F754_9BASI|nr:BQ2448_2045 [Microbotryum intermedium]
MSLLRPFSACDQFAFNAINLDLWTETYGVGYYGYYLSTWPDLFTVVESAGGKGRRDAARGIGGEGGGLMGYGKYMNDKPLQPREWEYSPQGKISGKLMRSCPRLCLDGATVMGKTEGKGEEWHGHVSAITVSPAHRRLGLASMMMELLERVSDQQHTFLYVQPTSLEIGAVEDVDLFVRVSNNLAIGLYESLGYIVYRRVKDYYGGGAGQADEDGFDMRKPMSRDRQNKSIKIPNGILDGRDYEVRPEDVFW